MDISQITAAIGSSDALKAVAAKVGMTPEQAQSALHGALEHVTAGGDLSNLAEGLAAKVGISPAQVEQFLPSLTGLLQGHSDTASDSLQGMLGGLMGSLQSGGAAGLLSQLDANKDGSLMDDALGLAAGFFGKKPG